MYYLDDYCFDVGSTHRTADVQLVFAHIRLRRTGQKGVVFLFFSRDDTMKASQRLQWAFDRHGCRTSID